ncbi:hypothetical protein E2562_025348 [Oryza meyeriana var. granulata]|uniref:Uncharacterized protein n=1 Tax=Oryza meyeriana var. granulata TaxID=110450 RepID=A0A6G1DQI4_9ORYZ|nr:hypothetical protein E2562_025348 [Oryza meyeriana var. granulata]
MGRNCGSDGSSASMTGPTSLGNSARFYDTFALMGIRVGATESGRLLCRVAPPLATVRLLTVPRLMIVLKMESLGTAICGRWPNNLASAATATMPDSRDQAAKTKAAAQCGDTSSPAV